MSEDNLNILLENTPEDSAEYVALLVELSELHIAKGDVDKGQALLQRAYNARKPELEGPQGNSSEGDEGSSPTEDDDWEQSWASGLQALANQSVNSTQFKTSKSLGTSCKGQRTTSKRLTCQSNTRAASVYTPGPDDVHMERTNCTNYDHVVELYNLNKSIGEEQLRDFVSQNTASGAVFEIKWVDEQQAVLLFSSATSAAEVLSADHPRIRVRPFKDASDKARTLEPLQLQPPSAIRPKTSTAVARRLISHHLQNRSIVSKEEEVRLAELKREKKQQMLQRKQLQASAWGEDD